MGKLLVLPLLLAAACVVAGAYGALHDQISYSVSPDYYHAFKFRQFRIPERLHGRLGAAIVGWRASWWMGLLIGVPVLLTDLMMPTVRDYVVHGMVAFGVVAATALVVGLGALVVASWTITADQLPPFVIPADVQDPVAFARAGMMHNFSYLGGGIGILTASAYLLIVRLRGIRQSLAKSRTSP